jgi:hypothetical protein
MARKSPTERQRAVTLLQTIYWVVELMRMAGVQKLGELQNINAFKNTDRQHGGRYAHGHGAAGRTWIKNAEKAYPGTAKYFDSGPRGVFQAILGSRHYRLLFLMELLNVGEEAFIRKDPRTGQDPFNPDFADARLKLLADRNDVDAFFAATVMHLGVIKRYRQVGHDFYAAYELLQRLPTKTAVESATRKHWKKFLGATLVEDDPYGDGGFRFPPQIRVCDFHAAGPQAQEAVLAAEGDPRFPDLIVIERPLWPEEAEFDTEQPGKWLP